MFQRDWIPMRVSKIEHRLLEKDDTEHQLLEVTVEVSPFTVELATDLDDFVRRTLYTMKDSEVSSKLRHAAFQLPIRPQAIQVRSAPDQGKPSYTIAEAKIGTLHARRSKKSASWRLVFTFTVAPESEHQLAQICEDYTRTRYFSFANAEATLFDDEEKPKRTRRAAASGGATSGAAAH